MVEFLSSALIERWAAPRQQGPHPNRESAACSADPWWRHQASGLWEALAAPGALPLLAGPRSPAHLLLPVAAAFMFVTGRPVVPLLSCDLSFRRCAGCAVRQMPPSERSVRLAVAGLTTWARSRGDGAGLSVSGASGVAERVGHMIRFTAALHQDGQAGDLANATLSLWPVAPQSPSCRHPHCQDAVLVRPSFDAAATDSLLSVAAARTLAEPPAVLHRAGVCGPGVIVRPSLPAGPSPSWMAELASAVTSGAGLALPEGPDDDVLACVLGIAGCLL
ncbi:MAG: hypothetical protein ACRDT8_11250 [Micromonosporaceae bacterium]